MKKWLLIGAGALLLVGAAVGGTYVLVKPSTPVAASVGVTGEALPEPTMAAARRKMHYYEVQPEFVVNLRAPSRQQFLMLELAIATSDEKQLAAIDDNMPELRHELLLLFGRQKSQALESEEGKLALREAAREAVDALLVKHYGPIPVDDVFLTRFVMQ